MHQSGEQKGRDVFSVLAASKFFILVIFRIGMHEQLGLSSFLSDAIEFICRILDDRLFGKARVIGAVVIKTFNNNHNHWPGQYSDFPRIFQRGPD